jgi:uncharacterized protein (TIGR03118 family)
MHRVVRPALLGGLALIALAPASALADFFLESNLVSNVPGLAPNFDANLQNPWGVSFGPTSPFWVSNQVTGNATLYNSAGVPQSLVVTIPPTGGGGNPTGQVFNSTAADFAIGGAKPIFIFSSLNGTISGWTGGPGNVTATVAQIVPGASYTGLTLGNNGVGNFLYAANDGQARIDVFDTNYALAPAFAGKFTDPTLPSGFTPYNIQRLGSTIFVTYENEASGGGVVNAFDLNGNFLRRISANGAGGPLDGPWGLALAPAGFGPFGGALLVGNEGDGQINAFDPVNGGLLGHLQLFGHNGQPFDIGHGLWALAFGNAGANGNPNTLFFTAGINDETGGLFGEIQVAAPEPSAATLLLLGGALFCGYLPLRNRRKSASKTSEM